MGKILSGLIAGIVAIGIPTLASAHMKSWPTQQSSVEAGTPTEAPNQKTFTVPDIVVTAFNGVPMGVAKQSAIVVYRAPHASGGYDAYVAFSSQLASIGWWANTRRPDGKGGFHAKLQLLNAANAALIEVDLDKSDVSCSDQARFYLSKKTIDPDLFDLIARARVVVLADHYWTSCKNS